MALVTEIENKKYGRLTIIGEPFYKLPTETSTRSRQYVKTICDCGNSKEIQLDAIKRNLTVSCGCFQTEARIKHGLGREPIYQVYCDMMYRCYNPENKMYYRYGGRGIAVCEEWRDNPKAFSEWALSNGYNESLQLDREVNSGNYEPTNCRFVTQVVNNRNRDFCVLNPMRVRIAKKLHSEMKYSYTKIASLYSVSRPTIAKAIQNKTWRNDS